MVAERELNCDLTDCRNEAFLFFPFPFFPPKALLEPPTGRMDIPSSIECAVPIRRSFFNHGHIFYLYATL
jgi:hypothetical protein